MKRLLLAGLALLAMAGSAAAADLSPAPYYKAPVYAPPLYTWTGFYVGLNGGGGIGSSKWDTTNSFNISGGMFGGTVGYNYQYGWAVIGAEGDIDWAGLKGSTANGCPAGCNTSNSWLSTARGRVGYAADRFMPYITGGLAVGNYTASTLGLSSSTTNAGWTVGAGIEFAITGRWSAKAEYLYVDLGNFNCSLGCGPSGVNHVSFSDNILRGGFNYRF